MLLVNLSLFIGEFARTGWLAFPPLSEREFSPGVGVDYYLVALQISGIGTVLTAVNFVTTILKTRAPGMVVAGCAILEAILDIWPAEVLGIADRGIREGILRSLMARDGYQL